MLSKLFASVAMGVAIATILAGYTQRSALRLGQDKQPDYWPRRGTSLSGGYRGGVWVPLPSRRGFGGFRGGGPSAGK